MTDKPRLKASITEVVKEEEYTLKHLTTISTFLQDLGRKQWPDMFLDIFALGEFIDEMKDSLYTDDAPIPFEDKDWGTDRPATEWTDKKRSRKEKPTRSATKRVGIGGGDGNATGIIIIGLAILTVVMCFIGLINST